MKLITHQHLVPRSKECVELFLQFPKTPPWRGVQLRHRDNFTFTLHDWFDFSAAMDNIPKLFRNKLNYLERENVLDQNFHVQRSLQDQIKTARKIFTEQNWN
jgi:hypothetical protein